MSIFVVGNGPILDSQRSYIQQTNLSAVYRFNDMENLKSNERTSLHIVRVPSGISQSFGRYPLWLINDKKDMEDCTMRKNCDLAKYFAYSPGLDIRKVSYIDSRTTVFPDCAWCGELCWSNTSGPPSTGAFALSELEKDPNVTEIHVFGMNWRGCCHTHVDFDHPIVPKCCTKCVIHKTPTNDYHAYGEESPLWVWLVMITIVVVLVSRSCLVLLQRAKRLRRFYVDVDKHVVEMHSVQARNGVKSSTTERPVPIEQYGSTGLQGDM